MRIRKRNDYVEVVKSVKSVKKEVEGTIDLVMDREGHFRGIYIYTLRTIIATCDRLIAALDEHIGSFDRRNERHDRAIDILILNDTREILEKVKMVNSLINKEKIDLLNGLMNLFN